jgi:Lipocalin-like domain
MRSLFVIPIALLIYDSAIAGEADSLVGTWKFVSWQVIVDDQPPQDVFGANPRGYLVLTREGRSIVLTTADNRKGGMGEAERAALHKSMLAYSGKYRIEGSDFITHVEVSWNEDWNGTEQGAILESRETLFIESVPAASIVFPGKTDFRRIVWEREK